MAFQLSPGVTVVEKDFTSIVPAVSSSTGAFAGAFQWGPVMAPTSIGSENELVRQFGRPNDSNFDSFFTAANFLSYTNSLLLVRADAGHLNAVATVSGGISEVAVDTAGSGYSVLETAPTVTVGAPNVAGGVQAVVEAVLETAGVQAIAVTNGGTGYTSATVTISAPDVAGGTQAVGTAVIDAGVITGITIATAGTGYTELPTVSISGDGTSAALGAVTLTTVGIASFDVVQVGTGYTSAPSITVAAPVSGTTAVGTASIATGGLKIMNQEDYENSYDAGEGVVGEFAAKYPGSLGNSLKVSMADAAIFAAWEYRAQFDAAPGTSTYAASVGGSADELHIVVIDEDGAITGAAGTIIEKFAFVSKASDAKQSDGTNNYYKEVLNTRSQWVWWMDHPTVGTNWGTQALGKTFVALSSAVTTSLAGGTDDYALTDADKISAFLLFQDSERYDVSLVMTGRASTTVATSVINNVSETRLDCVTFVSPLASSGDLIIGGTSTQTDQVIEYRDALPSTSYAVMDSGYKYQYDRYSDKYRYVPLNGDVAGLCARTDFTNDAWFSPGGLNRGQIKNVVRLAFNPNKTQRDNLYKAGVNPVVTFPGEGTVLFGDKTLLAKPSAFDRINVRRLFIVLEKAIATAAKYQLFEFNDGFTRAQFKNLVEPFLRDVQGRRGVTDFRVKCDETNNTSEVIDRNEFVADIFIKPTRSINFITLNFVAARTGINFDEIGG